MPGLGNLAHDRFELGLTRGRDLATQAVVLAGLDYQVGQDPLGATHSLDFTQSRAAVF
ncbi:MAG TPA: hypothetical protein VGL99_16000 [Chloroflexota bacterium]